MNKNQPNGDNMTQEKPQSMQSHQPLISLNPRCSHSISKKMVSLPIRTIERLLAVDAVNCWYADLIDTDSLDAPFSKLLKL